jgi:hypothetical protein
MSISAQTHAGRRLLTSLAATGSSQGTAFALTSNATHEFTTVGSSTGAVLPVATLPTSIRVTNAGSNTLSIYPPSGGTVAGGGTNAAYSLVAGATAEFYAGAAKTWYLASSSASGSAVPGGSNGQIQFNNSNSFGGTANLSYGSSGQLSQAASAAPGSPSNGDLWMDSTQLTEARQVSGVTVFGAGLIYSQNANVTITAAASTSVISTSGATGTVVWPAGFLNVANRTIEVEIFGYITTAASATGNISAIVKLNSTVIATTQSAAALTTSKTTLEFRLRFKTTVKATGSSGKLDTGGIFDSSTSSGTAAFSAQGLQNGTVSGTPAPGTQSPFDVTGGPVTFDVQIVLSAAVNTVVITNVDVRLAA